MKSLNPAESVLRHSAIYLDALQACYIRHFLVHADKGKMFRERSSATSQRLTRLQVKVILEQTRNLFCCNIATLISPQKCVIMPAELAKRQPRTQQDTQQHQVHHGQDQAAAETETHPPPRVSNHVTNVVSQLLLLISLLALRLTTKTMP